MGNRFVLTHLKSLKSLGVFDNFQADAHLPAFKKCNIIYGLNGTGKTTLSRFFAALEEGALPDHPDLKYRVDHTGGHITEGTQCPHRVRVFNADFIEANINRAAGLRHIMLLGEESKALADEVRGHELELTSRQGTVAHLERELKNAQDARAKEFTEIAKTIGAATSGAVSRTYRRNNAETDYRKVSEYETLSDEMLAAHQATVTQDHLEPIAILPYVIDVPLVQLHQRVSDLLKRSAITEAIAELQANHDMAAWVEDGYALHRENQSGKCAFCDQAMPSGRLEAIGRHFSSSDQDLREDIERQIAALERRIEELERIVLPNKAQLFSEMRPVYEICYVEFHTGITSVINALVEIIEELKGKLQARTTSYERSFSSDTSKLDDSGMRLRGLLERHNDKSNDFSSAQLKAQKALEGHFLKGIQQVINTHDVIISGINNRLIVARDGDPTIANQVSIDRLEQDIIDKKSRIANTHQGGAALTAKLATFLGRSELQFISGDDGYRVLRRNRPAGRLSEGERTAIAFLYFLVHLQEDGFDVADGIVVIDDPISSLDSSSIYQAFSFLKNAVSDAKQVFILTHNYDFMRLLLGWRAYDRLKRETSYYMIVCKEADDCRSSRLDKMDKLLIDHPTEYHFLFKTLHEFKSDGSIASSYHIPNVARKVLETFLSFQVPSTQKTHSKMEAIGFDREKKTAILKFTNDQSHYSSGGFDPALVPETQKNVKYLLEMIEAVAPMHYNGVVASFLPQQAA